MSGFSCEEPDHEQCERCGGCVIHGCICRLAGDSEEAEEAPELVVLEMGLPDCPTDIQCPKCRGTTVEVIYHEHVLVSMDGPEWPCAAWVRSGILTPNITEHLCLRCLRCRYGYPTKTADA